jgi:hypothetical protein
MRSGAAARLAGISASTLRIWEHRYGVVSPPKSPAGQRTYPMKDIERLRLIKRLTVEGHAIGTLAHLDIDALVALSSARQAPSVGIQKVLVVGHAAARKLEGRLQPGPGLVFEDLSHAERDVVHAGPVDVLVIHVRTLHASLAERIVGLRNNLPALNAVVVYSFGAEAVPESLRAAGMTVRREPLTGKELVGLIVTAPPIVETVASGVRSDIRRYSDADLIALAEIPSPVACECPRHLVEIVTLLVGFEQYSKECASQNHNDAALHRHLLEVTAHARAMLEQALARVVIEEGLSDWVSR